MPSIPYGRCLRQGGCPGDIGYIYCGDYCLAVDLHRQHRRGAPKPVLGQCT
jgi:hypothetical protein